MPRGRGRNPRRYLYYNKTSDRWYLRTSQIYITSRKRREELLPIWDECEAHDWDMQFLHEIKERVKRGYNSLGKGIVYLPREDKYALYIYHDDKRRYYGVYTSIDEAKAMRRRIIDSGYTIDPVRHKKSYQKRGGRLRYITRVKSGKWAIKKGREHYGTFDSLEDAIAEREDRKSVV